jgi:alkylation response protein AidB-like acyl-CoA dehydrogenase
MGDVRQQVRDWLATAWDPSITLREWWSRLADSGWGYPTWPAAGYGKGLSPVDALLVHDELAAAHVVAPPAGAGTSMGAQVLFAYGTDEQRQRWLSPLARGTESWCQFFSEPGAGSDLAALQTRAVRDGDEWVVNGQKVWNSGTRDADRGLLLARTDPDLPKHRGISFFVIDVDQPGVEVRPIRQMNGNAEFNETFFTDARVSEANLIGGVNNGFKLAMTTLTHERATFAAGGDRSMRIVAEGEKAGNLDRVVSDILRSATDIGRAANRLPIGTPDAMIDLARRHGRARDPIIRQQIAQLYALSEVLRFGSLRARAAAERGEPGPDSSVSYLQGILTVRLCRDLVARIAGPAAMVRGLEGDAGEGVVDSILTAPCHGIQGGSEQIQRNVIGERILGLPREPQPDRDTPFRQLRLTSRA